MPFDYHSSERNTRTEAKHSIETQARTSLPASKHTEKQDKPVFQVYEPKYKLNDLIISTEVYDLLTTVINAQTCWNKVFVDWDLKSVMGDRRNLFVNLYGAPGTGKTMAAHAIAAALHKKILCVNYAEIESKYVGETSKNLTQLFHYAADNDVIIFFDEADAFLSKRVTNMNNSTDVSVNQTRSVLLTLLNDYMGMVIFASNFISNYDSAFMRRIQYHVKFDLPDKALREKLWKRYIPSKMPAKVNFAELAEKFEGVSGSDISNAVLKAALKAAKMKSNTIPQSYFEEATSAIIASSEANKGYTVTNRPVSEEYALSQIQKSQNVHNNMQFKRIQDEKIDGGKK